MLRSSAFFWCSPHLFLLSGVALALQAFLLHSIQTVLLAQYWDASFISWHLGHCINVFIIILEVEAQI